MPPLRAVATTTNRSVLEDVSGLPVLCELDHSADLPADFGDILPAA